jgi:hypothetical protein
VFTARYALSPYIKQICFVFKWLKFMLMIEMKYVRKSVKPRIYGPLPPSAVRWEEICSTLHEPNLLFESSLQSVICGRYRSLVDGGSIQLAIPHSTYPVKSIIYPPNKPHMQSQHGDKIWFSILLYDRLVQLQHRLTLRWTMHWVERSGVMESYIMKIYRNLKE